MSSVLNANMPGFVLIILSLDTVLYQLENA